MEYSLGINTTRNLETLLQSDYAESRILVHLVREFIKVTPIDFCVIENGGYRTPEMQNQLFKKGVTKCDGYTIRSKHQDGLAVDLVPWINNKADWDEKSCYYLSGAFMGFCNSRGFNVTSGADWDDDGNLVDGWDPCHFEIELY